MFMPNADSVLLIVMILQVMKVNFYFCPGVLMPFKITV